MRAVTEQGDSLTPCEKASCRAFFFCNLLSDKGGRGRQFIGQWIPTVRGARDERAHQAARAVTETAVFLAAVEKASCRAATCFFVIRQGDMIFLRQVWQNQSAYFRGKGRCI